MKLIIDIPDGYVGVIMSNQRMEGSAMDKLIRQAIINGTPYEERPAIQCPNCLEYFGDLDFCPSCGARMRGKEE